MAFGIQHSAFSISDSVHQYRMLNAEYRMRFRKEKESETRSLSVIVVGALGLSTARDALLQVFGVLSFAPQSLFSFASRWASRNAGASLTPRGCLTSRTSA